MSGPDSSPAFAAEGDLIRAFLSTRDAPCPGCGYNLRGIAQARCPECEREVTLCVQGGVAEPRQRTEAVALLCIILIGVLGQIGVWAYSGLLAPGMPGWFLASMVVTLLAYAVECGVLLRLILALRSRAAAGAGRAVLKWALLWLA